LRLSSNMLVLPATLVVAFVAPSLPTLLPAQPCLSYVSMDAAPRSLTPRMGLFDNLKQSFENDPRLSAKRVDTTPGINKKVSADVKRKVEQRKQYDQKAGLANDEDDGEDRVAALFSKWKW
jgi:hypothetical protein